MRFTASLAIVTATFITAPLTYTAANAASFDCSKASSATEKLICSVDQLSKADSTLAIAYATAIGGLSDTAAQQMRNGQREWLKFGTEFCMDNGGSFGEAVDAEECLISTYRDRIAALENSHMTGGMRFFVNTEYKYYPDPIDDLAEYRWKFGNSTSVYPQWDDTSATASAFNKIMKKQGMLQLTEEDMSTDIHNDIKIIEAGTNRISSRALFSYYGHGSAHGGYSYSYLHFLPQENRLLEAADLFKGEDWKELLIDQTKTRLIANIGDGFDEDGFNSSTDTILNPESWAFTDEGLSINFNPYEVAPYSAGAPSATVPWDVLSDYIDTDKNDIRWVQ